MDFENQLAIALADDHWLAPLEVRPSALEAGVFDAVWDLSWRDRHSTVLVQAKSRSAPSVLADALQKATVADPELPKLLVVPYISDDVAWLAERARMSVADLCGNYIIDTPELVAIRRDQPNRFPESRPIRNVYAGVSSLVPRLLLREDRTWSSVTEVHQAIEDLGGRIAMSTVSKVLSALAEELMIEKERVRVLQAARLLEKLRQNYNPPETRREFSFRLAEPDMRAFTKALQREFSDGFVWTGVSSASRYVGVPEERVPRFYLDPSLVPAAIPVEWHDDRFFDCIALECPDPQPFFDANKSWASEIQSCLELSQLDKRERQNADEIARSIVARFGGLG